MEHPSKTTLMELAGKRARERDKDVADHLAACSECAALFKEEQALSRVLTEVKPGAPPAGFVQRTLVSFRAKQTAPRFGRHLIWSAALSIVLAGIMVWLVVLNLPNLIDSTAAVVSVAGSIIGAGYAVSTSYPNLVSLTALTMAAMSVLSALVLAALVKRAAVVK